MTLWIRIDADIGGNPNVWKFATVRELSAVQAVGHLVVLFGAVAAHAPNGDLSEIPDALLEQWAGWTGERGAFASDFRRYFVTDGVIDGWAERQGALIERAAKDRERMARKRAANRSETVREQTENNPPLRNGTVQELHTAAAPRAIRISKKFAYPPEFDATWLIYPDRSGDNPKRDAYIAWQARVDEGTPTDVLHAGTARYKAHCEHEQIIGTRFVMQGKKFYGPSDRYLQPWTIPNASPKDEAPRTLRATEMVIS